MISLQNGTVLDARGSEEKDIWIKNGQIVPAPTGAEAEITLDITDAFVVPGIIDTHVHVVMDCRLVRNVEYLQSVGSAELHANAITNLEAAVRSGVTAVRDLGARGSLAIRAGNAVNTDSIVGPRVQACGEAIGAVDGDSDYMCSTVDGPTEAQEAVIEQVERGATTIKCMASGGNLFGDKNRGPPELTPEELDTIVKTAKRYDLPVAAHAHGNKAIRNAAQANVDSIEHGTLMNKETAHLLAKKDITWVPTRKAIVSFAEAEPTPELSASVIDKAADVDDEFHKAFEHALDAGVTVAMGSDAGTAANRFIDIPRELELMVEYGMSPTDVFNAATKNGAALLGSPELARLEEGTPADCLVLPNDPREDVSVWQEPESVIADGTLVSTGH